MNNEADTPFILYSQETEPPLRKSYRHHCSSFGTKGICFSLTVQAKKKGKNIIIKCDVNANCDNLKFYDEYGKRDL